ncbi:MAG: response regulator, partial [Proteobacteria bacterium]|nr:response regulator [Pseudomonadota bacterium]
MIFQPGSQQILVADDDVSALQILSQMLAEIGFDVRACGNGLDALESIRKRQPSLLISDISMPGIDGFELCQQIKQTPSLKSLPVIFITGRNEVSNIVRAFNIGA